MPAPPRPPVVVHCSLCSAPHVLLVPYSGTRLCRGHFMETVERRARAEFRRQARLQPGDRVAVALSGGKDSSVALALVHVILKDRRDVSLVAVTVDEGIAGYRSATVEGAARLCRDLGVEHRLVAYRDSFGTTTDEIVASGALGGATPCSACGVLRRRALNDAARDAGATHLVTGHNLDDQAQSILMNLVRGDLARLARLAPHDRAVHGLVPRVAPLLRVPEKEVALYALLRGLPVEHAACPHSGAALRGTFRDVLLALEEREPGTRHALLRVHERLRPLLEGVDTKGVRACRLCGEPASGEVCAACATVARAKKRVEAPARI